MKSMNYTGYIRALFCGIVLTAAGLGFSSELEVTQLAPGYTSRSVAVGKPLSGTIAVSPTNSNIIYVSAGDWTSDKEIIKINLSDNSSEVVATIPGSIGGMTVLPNGDLVIVENYLSDKVFRARDNDNDGKFLSPNEITELITPLKSDFTGSQVIVAPNNNAAGIPSGSLIIQTADGGTNSELLVVLNPETASPSWFPTGASYFQGYAYNGGIGFDSSGNIILGSSAFPFGSTIYSLVNTNQNDRIDSGEYGILVGPSALSNGISDLSVSADNVVYFGTNGANVEKFALPTNLLTDSATPEVFAETNSGFMSVVKLLDPAKPFIPNSTNPTSLALIGNIGWDSPTNIILITPEVSTSAADSDWILFQ